MAKKFLTFELKYFMINWKSRSKYMHCKFRNFLTFALTKEKFEISAATLPPPLPPGLQENRI